MFRLRTTLTSDAAIEAGSIVMPSSATDLRVVKASSGSENVIGIAVNTTTAAGQPIRIAVAGITEVVVNSAVTRGNFARVSSTSGQAYDSGSTGGTGDFGVFLSSQGTAGAKAWVMFKKGEVY